MADARYPVFEAGQTLTKEDLNLLRGFLDSQDSLLGRLIGFGISCGVGGSVAAGTLTISPGLAIDQLGRPLLLDAAFDSPTSAAGAEVFDFVTPGPGGVTPVLVWEEVEEAAPVCGDTGCEAHAAVRVRRAKVVLAAGRLQTGPVDFSTEPLLAQAPLTVSLTGAVHGAFVGLKNAITSRLTQVGVILSADSAGRLAGLAQLTSDIPAVRIYKASFLNQVFFAVLDLLRCMSLHQSSCLRTSANPGVALGWLHTVGGAPVWDCAYRHDWEPPVGLSSALLGGACNDPCDLFLNRLNALLGSYVEPTAPAPADPPKNPPDKGDFHICPKGKRKIAKKGLYYGQLTDCIDIFTPPDKILVGWEDIYTGMPLPDDIVDKTQWWTDPPEPWDVYGVDEPDFAGAGVIGLMPTFGARAQDTRTVLLDVIGDHGLTGDVRVVTVAEAGKLSGYAPQVTVSLGDTMVLVADDLGKVVGTGRISNQSVLKQAGPVMVAATNMSQQANAVADTALARTTELSVSFGTVGSQVSEMEAQILAFDTRTHDALTQVGQAITAVESAETQIQTLTDFRESMLVWQAGQQVMVDTVQRDVAAALSDVKRNGERLDGVLLNRTLVGIDPKSTAAVNTSLVEFLGTMRRSVVAAAGDRGDAVRDVVARGDDAFAALEARAGGEQPLLTVEREAVTQLVESLVEATASAGAPAAEVRALRANAKSLIDRLR